MSGRTGRGGRMPLTAAIRPTTRSPRRSQPRPASGSTKRHTRGDSYSYDMDCHDNDWQTLLGGEVGALQHRSGSLHHRHAVAAAATACAVRGAAVREAALERERPERAPVLAMGNAASHIKPCRLERIASAHQFSASLAARLCNEEHET